MGGGVSRRAVDEDASEDFLRLHANSFNSYIKQTHLSAVRLEEERMSSFERMNSSLLLLLPSLRVPLSLTRKPSPPTSKTTTRPERTRYKKPSSRPKISQPQSKPNSTRPNHSTPKKKQPKAKPKSINYDLVVVNLLPLSSPHVRRSSSLVLFAPKPQKTRQKRTNEVQRSEAS